MNAYRMQRKTTSANNNCERNSKLSERGRRILKRIVNSENKKKTDKVAPELNQHVHIPLSTKTFRRELHKQKIYSRVAIPKPFLTDVNEKRRLRWYN
ncbi:hypothetical protein AVEN_87680-1 [Araneus ventricosus]|uniref:Transposase Tc1-like domain-containing protein n=1 Tax=Araneus ventricosus TaxID=182803 RepID=A0A4Y2CY87_ARAVE|nr:hypothetical protein AVEN_87680-1 [Araneus ventricosus]